MKLLGWILNITNRHRADIRRYQKGGVGSRIFIIVLSLVLAGASIGCEIWFLNVFYNPVSDALKQFLMLFGIAILALAVFFAALDYFICFSYVGFKMMARGVVLSGASLIDKKYGREISEEDARENRRKWLDLFVGFFEIALVAALIAVTVFLLFNYSN